MNKNFLYIVFCFCFATITVFTQTTTREVAVTIDDLPVVSMTKDIKFYQQITKDLLGKLKKYNVPAIGFVNEGKLYEDDKLVDERVDLLRQWLNAGLELGNHTYSHQSLNRIPAKDFIEDVLKGEKIIRKLFYDTSKALIYFRHPFLHTGRNEETRDSLNEFLEEHNYKIAPVTIDNSEWIFARAYEKAFIDDDSLMMKKIADEYIPYMVSKFEHFEFVSRELFGYEIKQVLLIHANKINADHFDKLAEMMIKRGYKFIPLKEALEDKAYNSADSFFGAGGISWLHRLALTAGKSKDICKTDLPAPDFVKKYAGVENE
ncbi:MAG: polysaccharide deacetylase family protein [Ignavibacteria bacterium]|nr:polysaccharide deacetylase family protein [Ignavibacteria bacterium]